MTIVRRIAAAPTLIAAAHGTRDGRDRPAIEALLARVRALRPGVAVRAAYLQFGVPSVTGAFRAAGGDAVVVPLLLSTGYHVRVDLPEAVRAAGGDPGLRLGPPLGPDPLLTEALIARLREARWRRGTPVVLAAAGSSDPRSTADVRASADALAQHLDVPVVAGFASGTTPTIADAVASLRASGARRVAVASYLIAPGQFHDLAAAAGADLVAGPLADEDALARLVLRRYDAVAARCARPASLLAM